MQVIFIFLTLLIAIVTTGCSDKKKEPTPTQPANGGVQLFRKTDKGYVSLKSDDILLTDDILYFKEAYSAKDNLKNLNINLNLDLDKTKSSNINLHILSKCKIGTDSNADIEVKVFEEAYQVQGNQISIGELLPVRLFLSESPQAICSVDIETKLSGQRRSFYFLDRTVDLSKSNVTQLLFERKFNSNVNYDVTSEIESSNRLLHIVKLNDVKKIRMDCEGFRSEMMQGSDYVSFNEIAGKSEIKNFNDFYHHDGVEWDSRKTLFKQKCILSAITNAGFMIKSSMQNVIFPALVPQVRYVVDGRYTGVTQYLYEVSLTNTQSIPILVAIPREDLYMNGNKDIYFSITVQGGANHINVRSGAVILDSLQIAIININPNETVKLLATTDGKNSNMQEELRKIVPIYSLRKNFYSEEESLNLTRQELTKKIPIQY